VPDEKYKMLAVYVWNVLGLLMHSAISDNSRALTFCASWVMSKLHLLKGQYCNSVSLCACGSQNPGARFTKYLTIYHKFIVRATYDSDERRAKISLRNIVS